MKAISSLLLATAVATSSSLIAAPVIEETFDYGGSLSAGDNIAGANAGTGFTGAWTNTRNSPDYDEPGNTAGDLAVAGGRVKGNAWSGIVRPIGSTLADANLLDNGATLWFSVIFDLTGANTTNADLNLALTNAAKFNSGSFGDRENLDGAANEGIGITHSGGNIRAVVWDNAGGRTESGASSLSIGPQAERPVAALIVGRIDWGADGAADETITLYNPDENLNLGTEILAATTFPAIDQSSFNNLALQFKDAPWMDEIRFGATSADVLPTLPEEGPLVLTGFTYDPLTGASEVSIEGTPNTAYVLVEADDLDFGNPDQNPVPLTGATVGTLAGNEVTTDGAGDATVQFNLGTGKDVTFIRAQNAPPLLDVDFEADNGGFTFTTTAGTEWAWGAPNSADDGGTPNPGGSVTEGNDGSTNCWGTNLGNPGFYADPTTDSCLRSPNIDLTSVTGATLTFAEALDLEGSDTAVLKLRNAGDDSEIATIYTAVDASSSSADWAPANGGTPIDLASGVGQVVYLEWCLTGSGGPNDDYMGWYIDDVLVTKAP